ncbi:MAG: hypothetical protein JSR12_11520 [Bacteroidetes bacterium]|nr:hypothetical protein [Bacteroidota bacterium]
MKYLNFNGSQIRLRRMEDGSLRIHELNRNFFFFITPWEEKEKDAEGVSVVLTRNSDLRKVDLFKLAKRLEKDDVQKNHDWIKNWNYLHEVTRLN